MRGFIIGIAAAIVVVIVFLIGTGFEVEEEGPAEQIGETIDEAAEEAEDAASGVADEIEQTGNRIDNAVQQ